LSEVRKQENVAETLISGGGQWRVAGGGGERRRAYAQWDVRMREATGFVRDELITGRESGGE